MSAVSFQTILCDNDLDAFDGHRDLQVSGRDVMQVDNIIGSANASSIERGNSIFTVRFVASKRHATEADAMAYCGNHAEATRGGGTFSGFGLTLDDAICEVTVRHIGTVTEAAYTITGSKTPS